MQVSALLALVLGQQEQTVFQRLREWYLDAHQKSGNKRRKVDVTTCFAPLLRWIVRLWEPETRQMVLVLDATTLGDRWIILSISVVICCCSIPVAWKVMGGHEKGSWRPHWEGLLTALKGSSLADWRVLVMADRGLYARWLFQAICVCGWHPFLRINLNAVNGNGNVSTNVGRGHERELLLDCAQKPILERDPSLPCRSFRKKAARQPGPPHPFWADSALSYRSPISDANTTGFRSQESEPAHRACPSSEPHPSPIAQERDADQSLRNLMSPEGSSAHQQRALTPIV